MKTIKITLGVTAMVFGVIWLAVFICALSDRLKGVERIDPDEEESPYIPSAEGLSTTPRWKRVIFTPFLALLGGLFFIVVFPMLLVELIFRPRKKPNEEAHQQNGEATSNSAPIKENEASHA